MREGLRCILLSSVQERLGPAVAGRKRCSNNPRGSGLSATSRSTTCRLPSRRRDWLLPTRLGKCAGLRKSDGGFRPWRGGGGAEHIRREAEGCTTVGEAVALLARSRPRTVHAEPAEAVRSLSFVPGRAARDRFLHPDGPPHSLLLLLGRQGFIPAPDCPEPFLRSHVSCKAGRLDGRPRRCKCAVVYRSEEGLLLLCQPGG